MSNKIRLSDYSKEKLNEINSLLYSDNQGEVRPYQRDILLKLALLQEKGIHSPLVVSPTGSGKTFIALTIIDYWQNKISLFQEDNGRKPTVGWVSMRSNLLTQTQRAIGKFGLNIKVDFFSQFSSDVKEYDILIFDEAHHAACASGRNVINKTKAKIVLGLTATPIRTDKASLLFQTVIRDANLRQLVADEFLSGFDQYVISDYSLESIVKAYISKKDTFGKTVFFLQTKGDARKLESMLSIRGVRSEVVTSETDRESQIKALADGRLDCLINNRILVEGFDLDTLQTVFVKDASKSSTIQMAGRALRKHKDFAVKNIVQSSETKNLFSKFATPKLCHAYLNGNWSVDVSVKNILEIIRAVNTLRVEKELVAAKKRIENDDFERDVEEYAKQMKRIQMMNLKDDLINSFRIKNKLYEKHGVVSTYIRFSYEENNYLISFRHKRIYAMNSDLLAYSLEQTKDIIEGAEESIVAAYAKDAKALEALKGEILKINDGEDMANYSNPFEQALHEYDIKHGKIKIGGESIKEVELDSSKDETEVTTKGPEQKNNFLKELSESGGDSEVSITNELDSDENEENLSFLDALMIA